MKPIAPLIAITFFISFIFSSCKKEYRQLTTQPLPPTNVNRSPLANAGVDQSITLPNNLVSLDGSGSTDPDNNITNYIWAKISGPATFNIVNANTVKTQVTNLTQGVYEFELKVIDSGGLSAKDTIQIIVNTPVVTLSCGNRPIINATLVPLGTLSIGGIGLVSAAVNNKILFAGGIRNTGNGARVDIYDITTNKWSTAELSKGDRQGIAVAVVGNKILFAGGEEDPWGSSLTTSRVDIYDVSNNSWSTAELSVARTGIAAATIGSKVFFAGGFSWQNAFVYSNVVDIYDNATNNWSTASLSESRAGLSATTSGNKIYFAGGFKPGSPSQTTTIDIFDAANNSWSISNMLEAKSNMASIAVDNKIYWAGGIGSISSFPPSGLSNQVEIRNLITGVSSINCVIPRLGNSAVIKGDNIVFFTGYENNNPLEGTNFEIYNTTTDTWSTAVVNQKIYDATIISVNNTIYVAGGRDSDNGGTFSGPFFKQVWKLEF